MNHFRSATATLAWAAAFFALGTVLVRFADEVWVGYHDPKNYAAITRKGIREFWPPLIAAALTATVATAWFGVLPGTRRFPPPAVARPVGALGRASGAAAAILFGVCLTCLALLHFLRPELDPRRHFLSEYVVGPYGDLMTTALMLGGLASVALAFGLARAVTPSLWLALACAGTIAAGVGYVLVGHYKIAPPPHGGPRSVILHGVFANYSALFATASFVVLPWAFRVCPRWRAFFWPSTAAGVAVAAAFFGVPFGGGGLGQRAFVGTATACGLLVATRLALGGPGAKPQAAETR